MPSTKQTQCETPSPESNPRTPEAIPSEKIAFSKYHGLGNDYLFLDSIASPKIRSLNFRQLAQKMSHRRLGPGADGIVVILPSQIAAVAMRIFNSDGSEAESCGNALRCLARICRERGYCAESRYNIETLGGVTSVSLDKMDSSYLRVGVTLNPPQWDRKTIPMRGEGDARKISIEVLQRTFDATCLSVGNPHCVLFLEEFAETDVLKYGPSIEHHPLFPNRVNAGFCRVLHRNSLTLTVWERGAGLTGACGTGAAAAFAAARERQLVDADCTVQMPGGNLEFHQNTDDSILMSGPATFVYDGVFDAAE